MVWRVRRKTKNLISWESTVNGEVILVSFEPLTKNWQVTWFGGARIIDQKLTKTKGKALRMAKRWRNQPE